MTRIAIVADTHISDSRRADECRRILAWLATDIAQQNAGLVLLAGDLYDRASTPADRHLAAGWIQTLAHRAPVVVVRGNHDMPDDVSLLARMSGAHPIIVEEQAAVHHVAGCAIACASWPRKAEVLAWARARGYDAEHVAADALRSVLRAMGVGLGEHAGPRILLAHAMITGAIMSTDQPLVGCDMEIGLADLALAGADLVALGHIHRHQAWDHGGVPMIYPGAPRRTDFGMTHPVGYVIADVERGLASWHFRATPATPMVLVTGYWAPEHVGLPGDTIVPASLLLDDVPDVRGAEVRLRYDVSAEHRDAARRAANDQAERWRAEGAVLVQVEERVHVDARARAPEVAAARTLHDQLRAYWTARGWGDEERPAERLLARLAEIEGDAS